jgi:hypothetical protein
MPLSDVKRLYDLHIQQHIALSCQLSLKDAAVYVYDTDYIGAGPYFSEE